MLFFENRFPLFGIEAGIAKARQDEEVIIVRGVVRGGGSPRKPNN